MKKQKVWIEISKERLTHNVKALKSLVPDKILCPAVKANAYGHGLIETARHILSAGADWLAVDSLFEARKLKESGIESPIYIMGYVLRNELLEAVESGFRFVVYNMEILEELARIGKPVNIHLKIETGNNRQGILLQDLPDFAEFLQKTPNINVEGIATHFADIEDTTDHTYAGRQFNMFNEAIEILEKHFIKPKYKHCSNTAATILFPHTHFNFVRTGIGIYGMWPSNETYVSAIKAGKADIELRPIMTWKTVIAQIKNLGVGEYIGYGCTYKTTHETRLAILPVGYYDGYDRGLSSNAFVLIHGKRAPIRGRVCMNMIMVDVTHIPEACVEDEVVLLGCQGDERISAELMGDWIGTINYEVPTRINERIPRIVISSCRDIKIEDNGEELELLSSSDFVLETAYFNQGIASNPEIKLRKSVLAKLKEARKALPKGWNFKIFDGYRLLETQEKLFNGLYNYYRDHNPNWDKDTLQEKTEMFVATPRHDTSYPSPHNTGGAVDLTLVDENGVAVDMGSPFDDFSERCSAFTNHFEDKNEEFHKNRMLLKNVMEKAGFANFENEWWHYSFGDQMWASAKYEDRAIYGSVELNS